MNRKHRFLLSLAVYVVANILIGLAVHDLGYLLVGVMALGCLFILAIVFCVLNEDDEFADQTQFASALPGVWRETQQKSGPI